jgi:hypothetical protein
MVSKIKHESDSFPTWPFVLAVTCTDPRGVEHTIQVSAQTLYEAVVQALRIFREDTWCEDLWQSAASLVVKISQPSVEHRVRIKDSPTGWTRPGKLPPR